MKSFDVVIIGAGLAGLQCARLLSREKIRILLVDRKKDLTKGIHTTGIFVRKTFEDFEFPPKTLGKAISNVTLYSPKLKTLKLNSENDEFRVGNMGLLYESYLAECIENGVEFLNEARYVTSTAASNISTASGSDRAGERDPEPGNSYQNPAASRTDRWSVIDLEKQGETIRVKTKVLIGADGARSRVAKDLELDENTEWIIGYEEVYQGVPLEGEPQLHCFLDAKLSPGYLAWISNDGEETHIGVGGYPSGFDPRKAYKVFKSSVAANFVNIENAEMKETRGGRIPVGGVLKNIANERGLLIGDAAGAVSPLTAGGLDPCMRLSKFAAEVVCERLRSDEAAVLNRYSGEMFRAKFTTRLLMRRILKTFTYQSLLEMGFRFLRGEFGKKIAEKIFFRRASFPDIETDKTTRRLSAGHILSR
ncbi:MAG: NAD(P)/FAD-dependent oxidoreductase [Pyrinomonadaceae bacterium]|nr:NAD(P)/FAD-dependent oxidoreductase [Pyrinomonadaceae bacterium]